MAKSRTSNAFPWIVGIAAAVTVLAVSGWVYFSGTEEKGKSFQVRGGESRPVLDPAMFTGQTRAAYEAAKKYPQVLDQLFCYCYCNEPPFHHVSLLSCFVDRHGAG